MKILGASKATPVDGDGLFLEDSAADGALKRLSWANLKAAFAAATATLTNKRINPRVTSEASSATPTINSDNTDLHRVTALAVNVTSFTTNLTGTPVHGQGLLIEITGTAARTLAWGASFEASTVPLPTTTSSTNMLTVAFTWNSATSKWRCIGVA